MFYIWNGIKVLFMFTVSVLALVFFVIWDILEFLVFVVWDTLCAILKLIVKLSKTIWNSLLCGLYDSVSKVMEFFINYTKKVNKKIELKRFNKKRKEMKRERQDLKNKLNNLEMKQEI